MATIAQKIREEKRYSIMPVISPSPQAIARPTPTTTQPSSNPSLYLVVGIVAGLALWLYSMRR